MNDESQEDMQTGFKKIDNSNIFTQSRQSESLSSRPSGNLKYGRGGAENYSLQDINEDHDTKTFYLEKEELQSQVNQPHKDSFTWNKQDIDNKEQRADSLMSLNRRKAL